MERKLSAAKIAKIAIFAAMSFILYFVKTPLGFIFPPWLEIHVSDIPALIGGFSLGPVSGVVIVLIKCLLKLPFSSTGIVGELADFLVGVALVLPSSLFYKFNKTKKGAIISLVLGSVCSVIFSVLTNVFISVPTFMVVLGLTLEDLVSMCAVIPNITTDNFYLYYSLFAVIPFNLLRCLLSSLLTMLIYKRLTGLINKIGKSI